MRRVFWFFSLFLCLCFSRIAIAQQVNWTGYQFGIHGGGVSSNNSNNLSDGSEFCFTDTSTTGLGSASANCQIDGNTITTSSTTSVAPFNGDSATVKSSNSVTPGVGGNSVVSFAGSGTYNTSIVLASSANSSQASLLSRAVAATPYGSALSSAVGLLNVLNLDNAGDLDTHGYSVGAHFGYLSQDTSNLVTGIEVDVTATPTSDVSSTASDDFSFGSVSGSYSQTADLDTKMLASARLKLGYAIGDFLPYVTGGIGFGRYDIAVSSTFSAAGFAVDANTSRQAKFRKNVFGAVLGGGLSWRISDQFVASAEGLYYFFDEDVDVSSATINSATRETVSIGDVIEGRLKLSLFLN